MGQNQHQDIEEGEASRDKEEKERNYLCQDEEK